MDFGMPGTGRTIPFFKMQGCGNDFALIDNRQARVPVVAMAEWATKVCRKAFGVGADGLIFLEEAPAGSTADYIWHFYNADGSRAEMCGNGARCAARLAFLIGLAPAVHVLGTDAGDIQAEVSPGTNQVRVRLTTPKGLLLGMELEVEGMTVPFHFVDTGVPHAVVVREDVADLDVAGLGRAMRYHEEFAPAGTNVNFIQVEGHGRLRLRTYERGVEAETYACGTGAVASVVVAGALGLVGGEVEVVTSGGEVLGVRVGEGGPFLRGAAELMFWGDMDLGAMGLSHP
ncbi:diaminopimelate epimerase [Desulfolutivibrio sulfoxidireducens]|uniref:diaminopimelate epimerase n=1 Tax=Desulfolutivibrio sulfoxidireducens TaxID=2773299 RepID=UPI00210D2A33|nr:diaminopimelate epimerase [Desulfolutivibrio sulfoxidireducens]